jgi:hypothetical protein
MLPAVTGLALGCSLAYWLAPRRTSNLNARQIHRPIPLPADDDLEDDLIVELVKSEIVRVCSQGDSIDVSCAKGAVRLEGSVLETDLPRILRCVARIPGIREIHDHLERHRVPTAAPPIALMHADAR